MDSILFSSGYLPEPYCMKLRFIFSLILLSLANFSCAGSVDERKAADQKKLVSRMYQMTVEPKEDCAQTDPAIAAEYKTELALFISTNNRLMSLLTASPYYATTVSERKNRAASRSDKNKPLYSNSECSYLSLLMRSMRDSPEGLQEAKKFETIFSE